MVAWLTGINVGGHGRLPMADLVAIAESCGFTDVRTYIQSGNVALSTHEADTDVVAATLRTAIAAATDLDPPVHVRTHDQLAAVVAGNPFLARSDDPRHHHVVFCAHDPSEVLASIDLASFAPEDAVAIGRDLVLFLPDGIGRSRLATVVTRRLRGTGSAGGSGGSGGGGTARNWNTLTRMLTLTLSA